MSSVFVIEETEEGKLGIRAENIQSYFPEMTYLICLASPDTTKIHFVISGTKTEFTN